MDDDPDDFVVAHDVHQALDDPARGSGILVTTLARLLGSAANLCSPGNVIVTILASRGLEQAESPHCMHRRAKEGGAMVRADHFRIGKGHDAIRQSPPMAIEGDILERESRSELQQPPSRRQTTL